MSELLQAAVAWAEADFSVIPVGSNKIPKIKWADCQINPWTVERVESCLLYTSPSPRDGLLSRMPSSA